MFPIIGEVVIRTNGGTLTVGSDSAVAMGQIWHYGTLSSAIIYTENNCFHTHGTIGNMDLKAGKAIAEDKGYVALVKAAAGTTVEEKDSGVFVVPSTAKSTDIDPAVVSQLGYTVTETGTTANEQRQSKLDSSYIGIRNAEEMAAFRDSVNSGMNYAGMTVKLLNDIDLGGIADWEPIGLYKEAIKDGGGDATNKVFSGTFDGQGYTINNLRINSTSRYRTLFGKTDGATLTNFSVNGSVYADDASPVVGYAINTNISKITNYCNVTSTFAVKVHGNGKVAGICIMCSGCVFEDCINYGAITANDGSGAHAGGIAAITTGNSLNSFKHCYNYGGVTNIASKTTESIGTAGGILGILQKTNDSASFDDCHNINAEGYYGDIRASQGAGGIVGRGTNVTITNCENAKNIVGIALSTGGQTGSAGNMVGIGATNLNAENDPLVTSEASLEINKVEQTYATSANEGISLDTYANATITGGTWGTIYVRPGCTVTIEGTVTFDQLRIFGGTVVISGNAHCKGIIDVSDINEHQGNLTINGGTFDAIEAEGYMFSMMYHDSSVVTINDGTFEGLVYKCGGSTNTATINGGSFKVQNPASSAYVKLGSGCTSTKEGDYWVVSKSN